MPSNILLLLTTLFLLLLPHSSPMVLLRVDKILSSRGVASRSALTGLIKSGRVMYQPSNLSSPPLKVTSPSAKFTSNTTFILPSFTSSPIPSLIAFHKPTNVLTAIGTDSLGKATLSDYLPPGLPNSRLKPDTFMPVGRLDYETDGLLLFSSDGTFTPVGKHDVGPNALVPPWNVHSLAWNCSRALYELARRVQWARSWLKSRYSRSNHSPHFVHTAFQVLGQRCVRGGSKRPKCNRR